MNGQGFSFALGLTAVGIGWPPRNCRCYRQMEVMSVKKRGKGYVGVRRSRIGSTAAGEGHDDGVLGPESLAGLLGGGVAGELAEVDADQPILVANEARAVEPGPPGAVAPLSGGAAGVVGLPESGDLDAKAGHAEMFPGAAAQLGVLAEVGGLLEAAAGGLPLVAFLLGQSGVKQSPGAVRAGHVPGGAGELAGGLPVTALVGEDEAELGSCIGDDGALPAADGAAEHDAGLTGAALLSGGEAGEVGGLTGPVALLGGAAVGGGVVAGLIGLAGLG